MGVALYLRNHYGQVGVGAVALGTAVYTEALHKAKSFGSSYMYKTVDCVLHKDKDFKAICDNVNKQSNEIWNGMHTDHKTAMLGRNQLVPIEMSSDVIKTSNAVTQWVQEAASCNKLLFICNNKKDEIDQKLSQASVKTIQAQDDIIIAKNEALDSQREVAKAKDETLKFKTDSDPDKIRLGECKELESLKIENTRLDLVEKQFIKLEVKHESLEDLYNKTLTDLNALKAAHQIALKKCGSWCV